MFSSDLDKSRRGGFGALTITELLKRDAEAQFSRRQLLASSAMAGLLAACGSKSSGSLRESLTQGSSTTGFQSVSGAGEDSALPYWLQGGFAPVYDEVELVDLEVLGSIPPGLSGLYVRNGSNPQSGQSVHWFFGDGMLHGVKLSSGRAQWYKNRYVQTPLYLNKQGLTDAGAPGNAIGMSNVSVLTHAGKLISSGEVGWPYEILAKDLSTVNALDFGGQLGPNFTAHPKIDPRTGLMHAFGYGFVPPYLTYYVISVDGTQIVHKTEISVSKGSMIHDFAISDSHALFWEMPVLFNLDAAVNGSSMPFKWTPEYGSRLGVLPLESDGADIKWFDLPLGFVFHGTNAFNDGDEIVLHVNRIDSAFDDTEGADGGDSLLHEWRVAPDSEGGSAVKQTQLLDTPMDFPMIDRRFLGVRHSRAWYTLAEGSLDGGVNFPGLVGYEPSTGKTRRWDSGDLEPGEVTFVPDSESAAEGEGWLLTFAYEKSSDTSQLVILDATDVSAGPVAAVRLGRRVPFGFHGAWLAD